MFMIDADLDANAQRFNEVDLSDLENGDPKYKVDFRSIYQEVLTKSLGVDAKKVLGKSFDRVKLWA